MLRRNTYRLVLYLVMLGLVLWFRARFSESQNRHTVESRVKQFGEAAARRWQPYFEKAGVPYPPRQVVLVGLKQEKQLLVYAGTESLRFIRSFPIVKASGTIGPKLKEGDRQVPEGLYTIEYLNPNSRYHLSMKISYPNAFDQARAAGEGRTDLGGDIMIHGKDVSIGCLAMGDEAAEDLFVLAAKTGIDKVRVILAPVDFRTRSLTPAERAGLPPWTDRLYAEIEAALRELPPAPQS